MNMEHNPHLKNFIEFNKQKEEASNTYLNLPLQPLCPAYKDTTFDDWEIKTAENDKNTVAVVDYFGTTSSFFLSKLTKINGNDCGLWMSITNMELQSHIIHLNTLIEKAEAFFLEYDEPATVVIAGLGMGMFLVNVLQYLNEKSIPANIIVIEQSESIWNLLLKSTYGHTNDLLMSCINSDSDISVEFIFEDLFKVKPISDVAYMYVDIWQDLGSKKAKEQSIQLVKDWNPTLYGYWGEEIDIAVEGEVLINKLHSSPIYSEPKIISAIEVIFQANSLISIAFAKKSFTDKQVL